MESHLTLELVIFIGGFFTITALLNEFAKRFQFPYTVALLILGFVAQAGVHWLHLETSINLSPDVIYYILLPILLFEAAMHLNFHQFRLQFKTITFLATFGMLLSAFVVAALLSLFIGLPFAISLLFGALISATDPIAVLALFKTLGAPRRLSLLADGESMFNDATAVIFFRTIVAIAVLGNEFSHLTILEGVGEFLYVFAGSMVAGGLVGYLIVRVIGKIENDALVETTLTLGAALLSFGAIEHFLHLSGVISAVIAGVVVGNLGRAHFSAQVIHFIEEFWEYLAFLAISLVFFFAAFSMNVLPFFSEPLQWMAAILAVLMGRAVSVYVSFAVTNRSNLFRDEPNVPLSWQHVLNWAGLRGVIPLVLVYSLPHDYLYRDTLMVFTLATLLFTLFVNGLTIEKLLIALKLHLPKKEEEIISEEMSIFELEMGRKQLRELPAGEFGEHHLKDMEKLFQEEEQNHKQQLMKLIANADFERSLRLQLLRIQRDTLEKLFRQGYIRENALFELDGQFDLQEDALEYPEVYQGRALEAGGKIDSRGSYRIRLERLRRLMKNWPLLRRWLGETEEGMVTDRYSLVHARLVTTKNVLQYLERIRILVTTPASRKAVRRLQKEYLDHLLTDRAELKEKKTKYPHWVDQYQRGLLDRLVWPKTVSHSN